VSASTPQRAWVLLRMPILALPGSGSYPLQPVHVEDLAAVCIEAASANGDLIVDAVGPERMPFRDLVALVRNAVNAHAPIIPHTRSLMAAAARGLGLLVRTHAR
jgi:nucleoside-diphosphate-sugar epimerase